MEYKILRTGTILMSIDESIEDMEKEVNAHIAEGWKPQGGICYQPERYIIQALVR